MPFALPRLNQSKLLFVPKSWQRVKIINWLKRIHAWAGFWGALLFLLMGTSGFLLNHRDKLKIDTGEPQEVSAIEIAVQPGQFADAKALGVWAKDALHLKVDGKPPRAEPGGKKKFMGQALPEREKWVQAFTLPDQRVTVDYVPGASFVSARTEAVGVLGTMKNLHKGTGLGIVWVLFLDTVAGTLVTMSLTGFLLWSRLHGGRLVAGAIMLASLGLAAFAIVPFL